MDGAQPTLAELVAGLGIAVPDAGELTPAAAEVLIRQNIGDHPLASSETIARLYDEYCAGAHLAHHYRPGRFVGDLLFFSAQTDTFDPLRTASAWRPFVSGAIMDRPVPTSHADMFTDVGLAAIGPAVTLGIASDGDRGPDVDAELDALIDEQDIRR